MSAEVRRRVVAIVLFDDVEELDFCGPLEVFASVGRVRGEDSPFDVVTVAERSGPVRCRNGLVVLPRCSFETCPRPELILVPGGLGTRREMHNPALLAALARWIESAELVLSVCTGALVLGRLGALDGLDATTHHRALDELRAAAPRARVAADRRFIDNGRVILSAGVSAGVDMALYVVARLISPQAAEETAEYIEYPWRPGDQGAGAALADR